MSRVYDKIPYINIRKLRLYDISCYLLLIPICHIYILLRKLSPFAQIQCLKGILI